MSLSCARRAVMAAAMMFAIAMPLAASAQSPATTARSATLQSTLDTLAQRARPGLLGVAVLDVQSGAMAGVNAGQAFPMMSVFKAPVAAAVLSRVDDGSLSLQQQVTITRDQVLGGSAVPSIGARFHGDRMTFTVERLLQAAVSESDNTAVDALIRVVGGPEVVTGFLTAHGIDGMRVDMDEAGVAQVFNGLKPGEKAPHGESSQAQAQRYKRGYDAFLADPRNRSTPEAAVAFLRKLSNNALLSSASTQHLLRLMEAQTIPNRLRAGVPQGIRLADKTGTSGSFEGRTAAYNDIGLLTWPDGHTVIVAAFLSDSPASDEERGRLFADLAKDIDKAVRP
ncbi:class A beta-lactamase [Dyella silvae]|uniref:class A beta-lactamase n=1 Tax=Dyella silvae TaxID=2994424 RepID=UPI00226486F5|nr:class A beta-lactamase [Dyella silvae]